MRLRKERVDNTILAKMGEIVTERGIDDIDSMTPLDLARLYHEAELELGR